MLCHKIVMSLVLTRRLRRQKKSKKDFGSPLLHPPDARAPNPVRGRSPLHPQYLILCEYNLFLYGFVVKRDGIFVDAFDFPAFLDVNPGISFGFVGTAHATYDTSAQTCTQVL